MKNGKAPYVPPDQLQHTVASQHCRYATRDRAVLLLSHYAGLRAKELALLTIGDVFDSTSGKIREVIQLQRRITKGNRFREVFLVNPEARNELRLYLATRSLRHTDAPLFMSQKGGGFSADTMRKLLDTVYRRAGVKASSHSGRRSFATNLIENGADIYAVKELLGHSSITTTQIYLSTSPERLKRFVSVLR